MKDSAIPTPEFKQMMRDLSLNVTDLALATNVNRRTLQRKFKRPYVTGTIVPLLKAWALLDRHMIIWQPPVLQERIKMRAAKEAQRRPLPPSRPFGADAFGKININTLDNSKGLV